MARVRARSGLRVRGAVIRENRGVGARRQRAVAGERDRGDRQDRDARGGGQRRRDRRGGVVSGGPASAGARADVVGRQTEACPIAGTAPGLRGLLWLWSLALRNELPWRRPTMVGEGVWVGGVPTRGRWHWLRARGV